MINKIMRYLTLNHVIKIFCTILLSVLLSCFLKVRFPYCVSWSLISAVFCNFIFIILIYRFYDVLFERSWKNCFLAGLSAVFVLLSFIPQLKELSHPDERENQFSLIVTKGELAFDGPTTRDLDTFSFDYFILSDNQYIIDSDGWKHNVYTYIGKDNNNRKQLTFSLPSKMIHDLSLQLSFHGVSSIPAEGILTVNKSEYNLKMNQNERYDLVLNEKDLLLSAQQLNLLFLFVGFFGYCFLMYCIIVYGKYCIIPFFQGTRCNHKLIIQGFLIIIAFMMIQDNYWASVTPDFYDFVMGSSTTWQSRIIDYWWHMAIALLPIKQFAGSFVTGCVLLFVVGEYLFLNMLLRKEYRIAAYLILVGIWMVVQSRFFEKVIIHPDQIVACMAMLAVGTLTLLFDARNRMCRILYTLLIVLCFVFIVLVRKESITLALPLSVVLGAFWLKSIKSHFGFIASSVLLGIFLCFGIYSFYYFYYSPVVLQEKKVSNVHFNLLRETLAVSYLSGDWELPDWFSEDAWQLVDKDHYMVQVRNIIPILKKNGVEFSQYKQLWLEKIKKHPKEYFHQKWISYQFLWSSQRFIFKHRFDVKRMEDTTQYGMTLRDFFRDGFLTFYLPIPGWAKQLSILIVSLITSICILFYKSRDSFIFVIWAIACSGLAHSVAFLLINATPNYRYMMWIDICGIISFVMLFVFLKMYADYRRQFYLQNTQNQLDGIDTVL